MTPLRRHVESGNFTGCLYLAAALLAACSGSGAGLDENGNPLNQNSGANSALMPTIESIQDHIFTPRCASCHSGASAPEGLMLSDAQTSYNNLVNVRSMEFPALMRVTPNDPNNSYVIHKLEGTQEIGSRMPLGGPYLDQKTIDVVRQWITDGAPPPSKSGSMMLPPVELSPVPES